jgi:hypothetical protein
MPIFADLALLARTEVRPIWGRIGNYRKSVLLEAFKKALKTIVHELDAGETLIELYRPGSRSIWSAFFWRAHPLAAVANRKLMRFHGAGGGLTSSRPWS